MWAPCLTDSILFINFGCATQTVIAGGADDAINLGAGFDRLGFQFPL